MEHHLGNESGGHGNPGMLGLLIKSLLAKSDEVHTQQSEGGDRHLPII